MRISGNQSAIAELFTLLDKDYLHPFKCRCKYGTDMGETHTMTCQYRSKWFEENYGCEHYVYDVEYDGIHIKQAILIHHGWTNGNLLDGCVK